MPARPVRQHVAPVVIVLNEIPVGKAVAIARADARDVDDRHVEEAGRRVDSLNSIGVEGRLIECVRAEGVRLVSLNRPLIVVGRLIERRVRIGELVVSVVLNTVP